MKIFELIKARQVFEEISQRKLPIAVAWKISKFLSKADSDYKFYTERMAEIIREYSLKDDKGVPVQEGGGFKINPELKNECIQKVQELEAVEIDIPDIIFTLEELKDIAFSPTEMNNIAIFIQEEQE